MHKKNKKNQDFFKIFIYFLLGVYYEVFHIEDVKPTQPIP